MSRVPENVGGDAFVAHVSNVSKGQVAIGKDIQQTQTRLMPQTPFKADEFLQELRIFKQLIADLDVDDPVKEDLEDQISNMRQDVKKALEDGTEPNKDRIGQCLQRMHALVGHLNTLKDIGTGIGTTVLPALRTLAGLAGLSL